MSAWVAFRQRRMGIGSISWKRVGLLGFGFFLFKGLLWLTLPLMLYWFN